jgi:general secretion pathway protein A
MYESYYGLSENPFRMTPDSRYFYASSRHQDALNHMIYAIEDHRGFVVITGEIGSGKTTLSRVLFQKLSASTKTAIIRNTQLSAKDLLALILDEFEIPMRPGMRKMQMVTLLNEFLIEQLRHNHDVVLLIDEAQNLTPSVLEEVRMLSNLETETDKLIQIILMGQPELKDKLWLKSLTQLRQRVTLHYHLGPMDASETVGYVLHRLATAGANGTPIFDEAALARIYEHTQGVPRLINGLCDRALLTGFVNESKIITSDTVDEVVQELPALIEHPDLMDQAQSEPSEPTPEGS